MEVGTRVIGRDGELGFIVDTPKDDPAYGGPLILVEYDNPFYVYGDISIRRCLESPGSLEEVA